MPRPQRQAVESPNPGGRLERLGVPSSRWQVGPDLPVLYLHGTPYEMGLQQGAVLREPLRELVTEYLHNHIFSQGPAVHWGLLNYARLVSQSLPSDLQSEMLGVADGAALLYYDIVLLNVLPDLLALTSQLPSWDLSPALVLAPAGSAAHHAALRTSSTNDGTALGSSFAIWGTATQSGELFVGYSLEVSGRVSASPWLLVVRQPAQGNASVALSHAGSVGAWAGMNEENIAVALSASTSPDIAPLGQPLPFLLREILQVAGSLGQAQNTLLGARRLCGGNVMLADGKGPDAVVIELSAHRQATFEPEEGQVWLARTDHFVARDLALNQSNVLSSLQKARSEERLARSTERMQVNSGWIGTEKALAFLMSDRDDLLASIQPPERTLGLRESLYSVLFCPGQLRAWVMQVDAPSQLDLTSLLLQHP
jgi:hypothetical protein